MNITRFEALGLLPDGDEYVIYTGAHEKKLRRFTMTLEEVAQTAALDDEGRVAFKLVVRKSQPRLGWLIRVTGVTRNSTHFAFYWKTDKKKVERSYNVKKKANGQLSISIKKYALTA